MLCIGAGTEGKTVYILKETFLQKAPGRDEVIIQIPKYTQINALEENTNWYCIEVSGWIPKLGTTNDKDLIDKLANNRREEDGIINDERQSAEVGVNDNVLYTIKEQYLRKAPNEKEYIVLIPTFTEVSALEEKDNWIRIQLTGWVLKCVTTENQRQIEWMAKNDLRKAKLTKTRPSESVLINDAVLVAKTLISAGLYCPSTAKFDEGRKPNVFYGYQYDDKKYSKNDDIYVVSGFLDASNAFGGMLRKSYLVILRLNLNSMEWEIIEETLY